MSSLTFTRPTLRALWAEAGDLVQSQAGMFGTVERVIDLQSLPVAVVKWSNGHTGRHTITTIRRAVDAVEGLGTIKRGLAFTHATWLDEDLRPLACVVTAVREGVVYYRRADALASRGCFPLSEAAARMRPATFTPATQEAPAP